MAHRSRKLPGRRNQPYFNEKRPVNLRVSTSCQLFPRSQGMLANTAPSAATLLKIAADAKQLGALEGTLRAVDW
jgi:hypothetical protein